MQNAFDCDDEEIGFDCGCCPPLMKKKGKGISQKDENWQKHTLEINVLI